jgi:hypothetical protein
VHHDEGTSAPEKAGLEPKAAEQFLELLLVDRHAVHPQHPVRSRSLQNNSPGTRRG